MTADPKTGLTYAAAGVDIDAGKRTGATHQAAGALDPTSRRDGEIGGFGGLFDLKAAGFNRPRTGGCERRRRHQAQDRDRHRTARHDRHRPRGDVRQRSRGAGAEPLFFLDYFATGKLDPAQGEAIVAGIARLLSGGLRADRRRDRRDAGPLRREGLRPRGLRRGRGRARASPAERRTRLGDVILGLVSSGVHSNGYSLVRRVVEKAGARYDAPPRSKPTVARSPRS